MLFRAKALIVSYFAMEYYIDAIDGISNGGDPYLSVLTIPIWRLIASEIIQMPPPTLDIAR